METGWRVHNGRRGYVGALRILIEDQPRRIEKLEKDTVRVFLHTHARSRKPSRARKGRNNGKGRVTAHLCSVPFIRIQGSYNLSLKNPCLLRELLIDRNYE